jgi:hypothetical protein
VNNVKHTCQEQRMADKNDPDRRDERGRREERGPSVFPDQSGRRKGEERDPEEEGSAGRSPS